MNTQRLVQFLPLVLLFSAQLASAQGPAGDAAEAALQRRAQKLHDRIIAIDTHTDTALELIRDSVDLTKVQADFAKLRAGRVDCCFYPVFVGQGPLEEEEEAAVYAETVEKMMDIRSYVEARPREARIALTADDIVKNKKNRKLSQIGRAHV